VRWNPIAANVLATVSYDNTIKIWDIEHSGVCLHMCSLTVLLLECVPRQHHQDLGHQAQRCVCVYVSVSTCVCACACVCLCLSVSVLVSVSVSSATESEPVCESMYTITYTHTHTHTHTHVYRYGEEVLW
jgi:WD40 repeat protein